MKTQDSFAVGNVDFVSPVNPMNLLTLNQILLLTIKKRKTYV